MKDETIKKLVFAALFAALSCVATMVIRIPTPIGGYIHAGDAVVLLAAEQGRASLVSPQAAHRLASSL